MQHLNLGSTTTAYRVFGSGPALVLVHCWPTSGVSFRARLAELQQHDDDNVFAALLRCWRGARGLSRLDLAGAAGVSAKHISFLETGRANPRQEMVLRLASICCPHLEAEPAVAATVLPWT